MSNTAHPKTRTVPSGHQSNTVCEAAGLGSSLGQPVSQVFALVFAGRMQYVFFASPSTRAAGGKLRRPHAQLLFPSTGCDGSSCEKPSLVQQQRPLSSTSTTRSPCWSLLVPAQRENNRLKLPENWSVSPFSREPCLLNPGLSPRCFKSQPKFNPPEEL